jgi:hypothetical protein
MSAFFADGFEAAVLVAGLHPTLHIWLVVMTGVVLLRNIATVLAYLFRLHPERRTSIVHTAEFSSEWVLLKFCHLNKIMMAFWQLALNVLECY